MKNCDYQMKKHNHPPTETLLALTPAIIEKTRKFVKKHWQCKGMRGERFEYLLSLPDGKVALVCKLCVHYPKGVIPFNTDEFAALAKFIEKHSHKRRKMAVSLVASHTSLGMCLSALCAVCGKEETIGGDMG